MIKRETRGASAAGEVTLGILAGGRGRRLGGCAKALIELDGRTLLSRCLDLSPLAAEVLVSVRSPGDAAGWGLEVVPDLLTDRGAPGGLVSLLVRARTPWLLAVAVDMPFFGVAEASRLLAARRDDLEVIVASHGGRLEPLAALYRTALGETWQERLSCQKEGGAERSPALRALVATARFEAIDFPGDEGARVLQSINAPGDVERLGARLPVR